MAANEWSHDASIARLTTVAEEYNFFQAARLLDGATDQHQVPLTVKFRGNNTQAFKPNFVESVEISLGGQGAVADVATNGFHLLGQQGPVPQMYAAQLADERQNGNIAPEMFLDIFNNRILHTFYEVKKRFDPLMFNGAKTDKELFRLCDAISSVVGKAGLKERLPERFGQFWSRYASALANRRVSYSLLKCLLSDLLGYQVVISPGEGAWKKLNSEQQVRLDGSCALGGHEALGQKFWSHDAGIRIVIETDSLESFESLLVGGMVHDDLVTLLCLISDSRFDIVLEIKPQDEALPKFVAIDNCRLGRTSWLGDATKKPDSKRSVVRSISKSGLLAQLKAQG